jgi:HPt (histidine-containing phosphotransfer) domain-containing protein
MTTAQALTSAPLLRRPAPQGHHTGPGNDLDPRILMATLGCNLVDHKLMMLMFGLVLSSSLRDLNSAISNQDWLEAGEVAHHLKSSAHAVGALRLAMAMQRFEDAALGKHTVALLALHADLPSMVSAFEATQVAFH